jgi:hypothetical protein
MRFLSPEWLAAAATLVEGVEPGTSPAATVVQRVTGGPTGDVIYRMVIDGSASLVIGDTGDPDAVILTESWDTAVAINMARLTPHQAVLSGLLVVTGDRSVISELAPVFAAIANALSELRPVTTF